MLQIKTALSAGDLGKMKRQSIPDQDIFQVACPDLSFQQTERFFHEIAIEKIALR